MSNHYRFYSFMVLARQSARHAAYIIVRCLKIQALQKMNKIKCSIHGLEARDTIYHLK